MAGEKQMVPGFNHNVKHKGTAYHVQTEDSGIDNPRIITHLFVGGNVIASKKTGYADIIGAENLAQVVRELMEEQHKEMLRNLIAGVYDDTDEDLAAKACAFQPGQIVPEPEQAARPPEPERRPAAPPPAPVRAAAPRPPAPERVAAPGPPEAAKAISARPPPIPRQVSQNPKQDLAATLPALERRSECAAVPPAPVSPTARPAVTGPAQRPAAPANGQAAGPASAQRRDSAEALFGEDLISEKSLDEVILSYLAEDLAEKG